MRSVLGLLFILFLLTFNACTLVRSGDQDSSGNANAVPGPHGDAEGFAGIIADVNNFRIRCAQKYLELRRYEVTCQTVVVTESGNEEGATAIKPGATFRWHNPTKSGGAPASEISYTVSDNLLNLHAYVLLSSDSETRFDFSATLLENTQSRKETESIVFVVAKSFGIVPQVSEFIPPTLTNSGSISGSQEVGIQTTELDASSAVLGALSSVCPAGDKVYASSSNHIYLLERTGEALKVKLYAGSSSGKQMNELTHRLRLSLGGSSAQGRLRLACDDNNLFVSDPIRHRVLRIRKNGPVELVAGTGQCGVAPSGDSPAPTASISSPGEIALAANGKLYFTESIGANPAPIGPNTLYTRIRQLDLTTNRLTTIAGYFPANTNACPTDVNVELSVNYGGIGAGNGLSALGAKLASVGGITVTGEKLIFTDRTANQIRSVDLSTLIISTIAGSGSMTETSGPSHPGGVPALSAQLYSLGSITQGENGSLYFFENIPQKIRSLTPSNDTYTLSNYSIGGSPLPLADCIARAAAASPINETKLCLIDSLAMAPGNTLLIADTAAARIRAVTGDTVRPLFGVPQGSIPSNTTRTIANLSFDLVSGVLIKPDRSLLTAEPKSTRIQLINANDQEITGLPMTGGAPQRMLRTQNGNIYYTTIDSVRQLHPDGTSTLVAGGNPFSIFPVPPAGVPLNAISFRPFGIAEAGNGNLIVSELHPILTHQGSRIFEIDLNQNRVKHIAGRLLDGDPADTPAKTFKFLGATGVAVAPDGAILVSEIRHFRITRINPERSAVTTLIGAGANPLANPIDLRVTPSGMLYIADHGNGRLVMTRYEPQYSSPPTFFVIAGGSSSSDCSGNVKMQTQQQTAQENSGFHASVDSLCIGRPMALDVKESLIENRLVTTIAMSQIFGSIDVKDPLATNPPSNVLKLEHSIVQP